ncbi:MAG TPA: DinB family protein [Humisphaera sp.]
MHFEQTIASVERSVREAFAATDGWFDRPADLRAFRPPAGGWTIDEILEHVTLTNHFLMLTLRKQVSIAKKRAATAGNLPAGESDLARLDVIGEHGSFGWPRPEHMEPTGVPSSADVRRTLARQRDECLAMLAEMPKGEGALCRVTMTVNGLGKIDLYQWLYFIAQRARRHVQQMAAIARAGCGTSARA